MAEASAESIGETTTFSDLLDQDWFAPTLAECFDSRHALRFAQACRRTRCVRLARMAVDTSSKVWRNSSSQYAAHRWQPIRFTEVDPPSAHSDATRCIHSVVITCQWADQGWGNRKGMVSVVKGDGKAPNDYAPWSADVVCGKEPAPHKDEILTLSFKPERDTDGSYLQYHLWARAGGGGGHLLRIWDLEVRMVVFI